MKRAGQCCTRLLCAHVPETRPGSPPLPNWEVTGMTAAHPGLVQGQPGLLGAPGHLALWNGSPHIQRVWSARAPGGGNGSSPVSGEEVCLHQKPYLALH